MLKAGISKYSDCLNCDENGDFSIQHSLSQVPKTLIVTDMSDMWWRKSWNENGQCSYLRQWKYPIFVTLAKIHEFSVMPYKLRESENLCFLGFMANIFMNDP